MWKFFTLKHWFLMLYFRCSYSFRLLVLSDYIQYSVHCNVVTCRLYDGYTVPSKGKNNFIKYLSCKKSQNSLKSWTSRKCQFYNTSLAMPHSRMIKNLNDDQGKKKCINFTLLKLCKIICNPLLFQEPNMYSQTWW